MTDQGRAFRCAKTNVHFAGDGQPVAFKPACQSLNVWRFVETELNRKCVVIRPRDSGRGFPIAADPDCGWAAGEGICALDPGSGTTPDFSLAGVASKYQFDMIGMCRHFD